MRLIAMGGAALAEGFALLGFETYPNATTEQVEDVVRGLQRERVNALVFLEDGLAEHAGSVEQVRREGGRIVIAAVPALQSPDEYQPAVEELVARVLGPGALEKPK